MTVFAHDRESLTRVLSDAGCVAAGEEAEALLTAANGDDAVLEALVERRCNGEPLAWITERIVFCGLDVRIAPGVYVPRVQTEPLARRAASLLPQHGIAVDMCTGSGAIAMVLQQCAREAMVVGTEIDPVAVACAQENGVEVFTGDLDEPLPAELEGWVDVMTAVVPYVPSDALRMLPRDVRAFEPRVALDGGPYGTRLVMEVVRRSARWLRPEGWLLLELGGDQAGPVSAAMAQHGFEQVSVIEDDDGDVRGVMGSLMQEVPVVHDGPVFNQINLVVQDMKAMVAFYERLGVELEPTIEPWDRHHRTFATQAVTKGFDFDLDSATFAKQWDEGWPAGRTGPVLGFRLPSAQAVDDMYRDLTGAGYAGQQPPSDGFMGARYAVVSDPDGNAVGLMGPRDLSKSTIPPPPED